MTPAPTPQPSIPLLRNLRDLGGLRATDGSTVRSGVLYRSATPAFLDSMQSARLVNDLGIALRIDLRRRREAEEGTSSDLLALERRAVRLPIGAGREWALDDQVPDLTDRVAHHYLRFLRHSGQTLAEITAVLTEPDALPALIHCTAGKDRTGVVVAVLLAAVGVTDDDIVSDYARSAEDWGALLAQISQVPKYQDRITALPEEAQTAEPQTMVKLLRMVREEHGGARSYLRGLGVSTTTLGRLRDHLLGPADS